jgi:anionic cell wall polymer biosynthesis LytR-Cps2A-Psr (LCP) family protein
MPRWRRRKGDDEFASEELSPTEGDATEDDASEDAASEDAASEDAAGAEAAEDDGWPEWAYEGVPRTSRSRRSKRLKRRRGNRRAEERPPLFDEAPQESPEEDPRVWVAEDPRAAEPITWPSRDATPEAADEPAWGDEDEERLRELGGVGSTLPQDEPDPVVVVESGADLDPLESPWDDAPAYDSRLEDTTPQGDDYGYADRDGYDLDGSSEPDEEPSYRPVVGDVVPGGVGPRRAALHERKRKRRLAVWVAAGAAILVAIGLFSVLSGDDPNGDADPGDDVSSAAPDEDRVETMLLYGTNEDAEDAGAAWVSLVSLDRERERGSVVYIPAHTAVEVPGRGLLPLGEAGAAGDVPLLLASTESLLGIEIDRYLELSENDARVLFAQLGPLEVDVPAEVSVPAGDSQTQLIFPEGEQTVEAERLADLLYVTGVDGDDVELGSRHLAFWDAVFDTFGERAGELEETIAAAGEVLGESDRTPEENAALLAELASYPAEAISLNTLPVSQVTVGDDELYNIDEEELAQFVQTTIGARSSEGTETRVQILNGNGVPGIGEEVSQLLVGEGFRVILSGNAENLDYRRTLIVTYDRSEEGLALAERARELLGVGEVQVSGQDQGIVDLTIVVGKDFLGRT